MFLRNPNLFVKSFAVQIISFVTSKIGSKKYLQNYNPIQCSRRVVAVVAADTAQLNFFKCAQLPRKYF